MPILNKSNTLTAMTEKSLPEYLQLYRRDDCPLCELAEAVLRRADAPPWRSIAIDDDATLELRYGERVPVLRDTRRERELDWPFDAVAVRAFVRG
jgi:hypothetical protein